MSFDSRITRYAYNHAGHLVASRAVTDAASGQGIDTLFERDPFGRLLQETTPDSVTSFRYNKAGQMVEADNGHRKLRWEYDPAGRMVADWQDKAKITHRYDAAGNRIATVLPDGEELRIGHNAAGQFESLHRLPAGADTEQLLTRISRNELGREIRRQHGNGLSTESDYDPQGRLHKLRVAKTDDPVENPAPVRPLLERTYGYNRSGQLSRIEDSLRGTRNYHYDALDRLTQVEGPNPEHFVHDPASNILAAAGSAEEAKEQAGSAQVSGNRLKFRGDTHYEYDIHGNRVAALRGKGQKLQTRYRYNSKHQLTAVSQFKLDDTGEEQLQAKTEYQYDPLGRRICKQGKDAATEFLWNGDVLLQEVTRDASSGSGQNLKSRIYYFEPATFNPVALSEGAQLYHYHLDHLGTPDTLTDVNGNVVWSLSYKTYGNLVIAHTDKIVQPFRFLGQYHDIESGLHYNRYRFYDPVSGLFTQQDPVGLLGGENNYQYVPNPVAWVDPYGLTCKENSWNTFQRDTKGHFSNSSEAAKSYQRMKEIRAMPKPTRPDPSTYLPQSYIDAHIANFESEGAGFIAIESWLSNPKYQNMPPRNFVGLRSEMDEIIRKYEASGKDWKILREELALGKVDLSNESILYVKVQPGDSRFSYDIPYGNEAGAYPDEWVPGGETKGGATEAALVGSDNISHKNSLDELSKQFDDTERLQ